ncbi:hypothetical protein F5Y03DRAFT_392242 [Xylaria venustula]|nr:hypothetical protein F5Y03DRAFT_392242 [Xylaria venustula]
MSETESYPTVSHRIRATKQCALEWFRDLEEIRSPQEVFEEEVHLLEDKIHEERQHILSGLDNEQMSSALDQVVQYSGQLKALQITYEATVDEQETTYQQSLQSSLERLASDIVETLGISLVEKVLHLVKPQPSPVLAKPIDSGSVLSPDQERVAETPPKDSQRRRKRGRPISSEFGEPPQRRLRSDSNRMGEESPVGIARQRQRKHVDGITDPTPGEVYLGYWPKSRSWLAVLLLPLGDFNNIGLNGTIADTGLLNDIPPCYRYSRKAKVFRGWQDGFDDAGPFVMDRQFPVMYFDDQFPKRSSVGWMPAKDLKLFDPEDPSIRLTPNYGSALEFIKQRDAAKGCDAHQEEAAAMENDGNQEPHDMHTDSRSIGFDNQNSSPSKISEASETCIIVSGSDFELVLSDSEESSPDFWENQLDRNDMSQNKNQDKNLGSHSEAAIPDSNELESSKDQNQDRTRGEKQDVDQDRGLDLEEATPSSKEHDHRQIQTQDQNLELEVLDTTLQHADPDQYNNKSNLNQTNELEVLATLPQNPAPDRADVVSTQNQDYESIVLSADQHSDHTKHADSSRPSTSHSEGRTDNPTRENNRTFSVGSTFLSVNQRGSSVRSGGSSRPILSNASELTQAAIDVIDPPKPPNETGSNVASSQLPSPSNGPQTVAPRSIKKVSAARPVRQGLTEKRPSRDASNAVKSSKQWHSQNSPRPPLYPPMSVAPLPHDFISQAVPPWLPDEAQNSITTSPVMQPLIGGLPSPTQRQVHTGRPQVTSDSPTGGVSSVHMDQQRATSWLPVNRVLPACSRTGPMNQEQRMDSMPSSGLLPSSRAMHIASSALKASVDSSPKSADMNMITSRWQPIQSKGAVPAAANPSPGSNYIPGQSSNHTDFHRNAEGLYICPFCTRGFIHIREHVQKFHAQRSLGRLILSNG